MKYRIFAYSMICLFSILAFSCVKEKILIKEEKILKKVPVITWGNPTDISVGELLSDKQLNATADVAGTFVYKPDIGTKLYEGTKRVLKVEFTPTDTSNYDTISKSIFINVKPIFYGTVTDVEGNVYKIVTIGSQTWMKENLKTTKFNNGDPIPLVKDPFDWGTLKTAAYCWYNNDSSYKKTYGALYNFYAIDSSNVCPIGWHVPDFYEWSALASYLGLIIDAGSKIKENDTEHWAYPNAGATNESGFTGLPGGERGQYATISGGKRPEEATFYSLRIRGYWWTSFEENKTNAYYFYVEQNSNAILREHPIKSFGASIRCIKD